MGELTQQFLEIEDNEVSCLKKNPTEIVRYFISILKKIFTFINTSLFRFLEN